jgi:ABC-type Zn uptake system ZnuABC Zn-binding protein ZnuA/ABC-type Mn2+/Zn2+ transport system permease subunit
LFEPFQLPFVQRGLFEVLLLSIALGVLGTWIVVRGLAFYSHALATSAFPGLVLADGLGFAPQIGALGVGLLFAVVVGRLGAGRRELYDSRTALALVGALALGVILASDVFHSGSNIETLLFGSLLVLEPRDLIFAGALSVVAVVANLLLGRSWLTTGFDPQGARSLGVPVLLPDLALLGLVALAAVAVLSAVGALLATALLVVPAATTRLWTQRMPAWQIATVLLVAAEGVAGLWLSAEVNAPPGASIAVLTGGGFVVAAAVKALPRRRRRRLALAPALAAACAVLAGCTHVGGSSGNRLSVVATTTQIADFARNVGGDDVDVHQILQPNTDPHEYEPRPADVTGTAGANVVFESGDELDTWMDQVVSESGTDGQVVDLSTHLPVTVPGETSGPEASRYDPHWWHDPVNAEAAVREIRDAMIAADPSRRDGFERRAEAYLKQLRTLDAGIKRCFAAVPPNQRRLVTDHDAFNYFAKRYGIQVVGAVIPSQTTEAQTSAGDISQLAEEVRREHVRAIFPESSLNPDVAHSLAKQTGAISDLTLYGDTLGPAGSAGATYLMMEEANADAMVRGFTGGQRGCRIGGLG